MATKTRIKLTPFELEIMSVLWELGKGSVREIMELLPETRRPAYTTVQTIVYRLEEKGALRRARKIGNAHIFEPVVSRKEAHHRLIDDLLSLFGGSFGTYSGNFEFGGEKDNFDYGLEHGIAYSFAFQPRRALEKNSLLLFSAATAP